MLTHTIIYNQIFFLLKIDYKFYYKRLLYLIMSCSVITTRGLQCKFPGHLGGPRHGYCNFHWDRLHPSNSSSISAPLTGTPQSFAVGSAPLVGIPPILSVGLPFLSGPLVVAQSLQQELYNEQLESFRVYQEYYQKEQAIASQKAAEYQENLRKESEKNRIAHENRMKIYEEQRIAHEKLMKERRLAHENLMKEYERRSQHRRLLREIQQETSRRRARQIERLAQERERERNLRLLVNDHAPVVSGQPTIIYEKPAQCCICLDPPDQPLSCGHWTHLQCILNWKPYRPTCPECLTRLG